MLNRSVDFIVLAQTRRQQNETAERARFAQDPHSLKEWEKERERKLEATQEMLAQIEKEEKRHEMQKFYSYVALLRSKIEVVDEGREDLWKVSSQTMVSVNDEQVADLCSRMELISARTNKNASEVKQLLGELEDQNRGLLKKYSAETACMRIRLIQYDALVRKFTQSLGSFHETENAIQRKNQDLLVRRFKIVQPDLTTEQILDGLDGGGGGSGGVMNVFAFAGNAEDLEKKLERLQAQRRSMMRLEKSIIALNKMFLEMQSLVLAQGEALNNIESYTQHTLEYQKKANLEQAVELQKNIRKQPSWAIHERLPRPTPPRPMAVEMAVEMDQWMDEIADRKDLMNRLEDFQKASQMAQLDKKAEGMTGASRPMFGGNILYQPFQKSSSSMERGESNGPAAAGSIPVMTTAEDEQMEMPRFYAQELDIMEKNKRVLQYTDEIEKLHKEALSTADSQASGELSDKIEALMSRVTQMTNKSRQMLREMEEVTKQISTQCSQSSSNYRIRVSKHQYLTQKFMAAMRRYQKMQETYQDKYRAQLQRQYKIVKPKATEAELRDLTKDPEALKVQVFAITVKEDSKKTLGQMKDRLKDMQNIEKSVLELQQIYLEMQDLVVSQGAIINRIEFNVDQIEDYTAQASKNMGSAVESAKAIQKKKWYIALIIIVVVSIIIIIVFVNAMINLLPTLVLLKATGR